jgi:hypothetical protein
LFPVLASSLFASSNDNLNGSIESQGVGKPYGSRGWHVLNIVEQCGAIQQQPRGLPVTHTLV